MEIENTVSSIFDPRSSIVKSVFDCRLSGVVLASCCSEGSGSDAFSPLFVVAPSHTRG